MYNKIYLLLNKINGKIYVGQTWHDYKIRMQKNGSGYKNCRYLYTAIQKYGVENFEYITLAECETQEEADKIEEKYINIYNSRCKNIGYNIRDGGSNGKHSEETKIKISYALSGRCVSEETRSKISQIHKGLRKPPHSEEWKQQTSEFMKIWHIEHQHPMQGRRHTQEVKDKISEKLTGKRRSEESIEKYRKSVMESQEVQNQIIEAYLDRKTIKEIKKMFNIGGNGKIYRILDINGIKRLNDFGKWTGKKHSEETKMKMSKSKTEYWKNNKS